LHENSKNTACDKCLEFIGCHVYLTPLFYFFANSYTAPYGTWKWCIAPLLVGGYGMFLCVLGIIAVLKLNEPA
jgi:hypothetical protein